MSNITNRTTHYHGNKIKFSISQHQMVSLLLRDILESDIWRCCIRWNVMKNLMFFSPATRKVKINVPFTNTRGRLGTGINSLRSLWEEEKKKGRNWSRSIRAVWSWAVFLTCPDSVVWSWAVFLTCPGCLSSCSSCCGAPSCPCSWSCARARS